MELSKFLLPTGETISCVLWNELYHITGTDIVRSLVSRFESFGRPVRNIKKFEEGVFSDLRNLKPGADACLEEPKSPFLEMLYRNNCIRTQKKQKVFYWYSVPHDRLFLDAMERDLKREQAGTEPTSQAVAEPAVSCTLETVRDLVERLSRRTIEMNTITETLQSFTPDGVAPMSRQLPSPSDVSPTQAQLVPEGALPTSTGTISSNSRHDSGLGPFDEPQLGFHQGQQSFIDDAGSDDNSESKVPTDLDGLHTTGPDVLSHASDANSGLFGSFTLFEGSPTYKKRRRRSTANPSMLSESIDRSDLLSNGNGTGSFMHGDSRHGSIDFDQDTERFLASTHNGGYKSHSQTGGFMHESSRPAHHHGSSSISSLQSLHGGSNHSSRSYACPVQPCGRLFKRLEHLKRHWRTHTLERPYACNICSKRFSRSDNLAAHRKTHDKPSWANDDDSSAPRGDGDEDDLDGDEADNEDHMRISKGYASDHSMTRKRRRMFRDRGMESMSERESPSGQSSGDEDDDGSVLNMMRMSTTLSQEQQLQLHRQGFAKQNAAAAAAAGMAAPQLLQAQHASYTVGSQRAGGAFQELASQQFMPAMAMMTPNQPYAAFTAGPLSAGFGGFLPNQSAPPPPLFTLDEEEEEEEISDMEKLRYKYEYEIKAAIDSTPVLSEVTKLMSTPYNAGAFSYGGVMPDYTAYGSYPLATPVTLGTRYPFDPAMATAAAVSTNMFATPMVPSSSSASSASVVTINNTSSAQSNNYPVVHATALPPSHHHQEYLEFTLGSMMPL
ncbi:homeodomain transcription factor ste12 [Dissophora globulifera]|nr:homeodomain transcription factor ste12 [Dissophora globulifera]